MNTKIDKSKEVKASLELLNQKLHFQGQADENQPISIDYFPPYGDGLGYTSLELLLLSLSSCLASSVALLLRKMQKTVTTLKIESKGNRKSEHPTGFSKIEMTIYLSSPDIQNADIEKAIQLSESSICPVWSMLKGNVEIEVKYFLS